MVDVNSDVVVVGGGPTGSFSALHAAKLGVRVTLCEEHDKVGSPAHCTGHVSLSGIRSLNLGLPKNILENEIKSATFHSPSGYRFSVRFASPVTCVINRELFDQHLSNMASEAGVKVLKNTHVDSLLVEKGVVRGVAVKQRKKTQNLESKAVIDAEGVASILLKRAELPSLNRRMIVNGVQAEVDRIEGTDEDTVEVFLSSRFAPGFFAWIVPRRDGSAKVGLATSRGSVRDCFHHFINHNPVARRRLRRSKTVNIVYHPISLGGPIPRTFYDGLLIVGDAASQVKPTTGGGIIMGLKCAKIAGKVAAYAARYTDSSAFFLSEYERRWKREMSFDMMVMKRLRRMLDGFSDKQFDKLIALCSRLRLDENLKNVRDVDFQGSSLIRMVKSPRVLATALYFLKTSFL